MFSCFSICCKSILCSVTKVPALQEKGEAKRFDKSPT